MRLKKLIIADPVREVAEVLALQCETLAEGCIIVTHADELVRAVTEHRPEMLILSIELGEPLNLLPKLHSANRSMLITGTYRELTVRDMEKLGHVGMADFFAQPVDVLEAHRAASEHFGRPFRRHTRHNIGIDVGRLDAVVIGRTVDISEGGMLMEAAHPVAPEESILCLLNLPDREPLRVRCEVLTVDGVAPQSVRARIQFTRLRGPEHVVLLEFLASPQ